MPDSGKNPFAELLDEHGDDVCLSIDGDEGELLGGEASRHFPEKRNRRRSDRDVEVIARLHDALEAIDNGETYSGIGDDEENLTMSDYYRQF